MNKVFFLQLLAVTFLFYGCKETTSTKESITDITLNVGESVRCSNTQTFKISPLEQTTPQVTILNDIATKSTTITLDSNSSGSLVVKDCKKI